MAGSFHSDRWYRVAALVPSLRSQVRIHRHRYRGDVFYVLQDAASTRMLRFDPASARLFALMDGKRSVETIWSLLVADKAFPPPRQDEVIDLLSQAHEADLVQADLPPEITALADRRARQRSQTLKSRVLNPMSLKIPLWDPDWFLTRTVRFVRPLFSRGGFALCALIVAVAAVQAGIHWDELTSDVYDRLMSAGNLLLISLIYPIVKAVHELGHGYAVKARGGEVHEMGVMLVYLMPVPYVEASAANAFADKWHRVTVSSAGIVVELLLASVALFVWVAVEPNIVRAIAFNVMTICGMSTLLFNGNPLMRYDGYYALADVTEMPNLGQRSNTFWTRLLQKKLLRLDVPKEARTSAQERAWLVGYAPTALIYRLVVMTAIALWLAAEFFFIGVLLALLMAWSMAIKPLWKALMFLVSDSRLAGRRQKAFTTVGGVVVVAATIVALVPVPLTRAAEGVVWIPDDAQIRAEEDGFVDSLLVDPNTLVEVGTPIVVARSSQLTADLSRSAARVRELEIDFGMKQFSDRSAAAVAREALAAEAFELGQLQDRQSRLIVRSAVPGVLSMANSKDLVGRHVKKGEMLGYVLDDRPRVVRVVIEQDDIDLVRTSLSDARLRVAGRIDEIYETEIVREIPAGQNDIPAPALGVTGGGRIVQDPTDPEGVRALNRVFQFDFTLPADLAAAPMGARVHLRLEFPPEPIWNHVHRRVRQLLLSRLGV